MESAKTIADLIAPATGEITAVNEDLKNEPTKINKSPMKAGWVAEMTLKDPEELSNNFLIPIENLLDEDGYEKYCEDINK